MAAHAVGSAEWVRLRNEVVPSYYAAAVQRAAKWGGQGVPADDLVGEAVAGLMAASEKFDIAFGNLFLTYGRHRMDKNCRDAVQRAASPASGNHEERWRDSHALSASSIKLSHELGRQATIDEAAEAAGLDHFEAVELLAAAGVGDPDFSGVPSRPDMPNEADETEATDAFIRRLRDCLDSEDFATVCAMHGIRTERLSCRKIAKREGRGRTANAVDYGYRLAMRKVLQMFLDEGLGEQETIVATRILASGRREFSIESRTVAAAN